MVKGDGRRAGSKQKLAGYKTFKDIGCTRLPTRPRRRRSPFQRMA